MDITRFKLKLLDKQRELEEDIARLRGDAASTGGSDVHDSTDSAEADADESETLDQATVLTHTLEQVRDALQRIADGSYGKCADCGEPIEPARLEATPWTPYCRQHQEQRESRMSKVQGSTL